MAWDLVMLVEWVFALAVLLAYVWFVVLAVAWGPEHQLPPQLWSHCPAAPPTENSPDEFLCASGWLGWLGTVGRVGCVGGA